MPISRVRPASTIVARCCLGHRRYPTGVAEENIPDQVRVRLGKRQRLLESGTEPYQVGYGRTATAAELRVRYGHLPPDTFTGEVVSVAGRVMLSRIGGKLCFARLRDGTGD